MIELDIKIRAKNDDNLKLLINAMIESLSVANRSGKVDVQFSASTDGDTMTLIRKEIRIPSGPVVHTDINDFILKADFSVRTSRILNGSMSDNQKPFKYAEDITEERFLKCLGAGRKSWEEIEEELKRQNIKY